MVEFTGCFYPQSVFTLLICVKLWCLGCVADAVISESLREGENSYFSYVNDLISARRGLKFIRTQAALPVQE